METDILSANNSYNDNVKNAVDIITQRLKDSLGLALSDEQRTILCSSGNLVINACAGSGKTTLSQLIAITDIYARGIPPHRILNLTFSNKSAEDITAKRNLMFRMLGLNFDYNILGIKTLHGFCKAYLECYCTRLGLLDISVISAEEKARCLDTSYKKLYNIRSRQRVLSYELTNRIIALFDYIIDKLIIDNQAAIEQLPNFQNLNMRYSEFIRFFEIYEQAKKAMGKIDFSDMQYLFLKLLESQPDIAETIQSSYDRIIVDEVQDLSEIQFRILMHILGETSKSNLVLIGDINQAIYSWRGSMSLSCNIFDRTKQLLVVNELPLSFNMRSPINFIDIANKLIANNFRGTKNTPSQYMTGYNRNGHIVTQSYSSYKDMTHYIANYIMNDVLKGYPPDNYEPVFNDIAIIYRNNADSLFLIDELLKLDIPINVKEPTLIYDDTIIHDILQIIDAVNAPLNTNVVVETLCQLMSIDSSMRKFLHNKLLRLNNSGRDCSLLTDEEIKELHINLKTWYKVKSLFKEIETMLRNDASVAQIAQILFPFYMESNKGTYSTKDEIANQHIKDIETYLYTNENSISFFIEQRKTIKTKLAHYRNMNYGIVLSTIHGIKGLEFSTVFGVGLSSYSLPNLSKFYSLTATRAKEYIMEERNAFYVLLTRAKDNLIMLYLKDFPSIFLLETGLLNESGMNRMQPIYDKVMKVWDLNMSKIELDNASNDKACISSVPNFKLDNRANQDFWQINDGKQECNILNRFLLYRNKAFSTKYADILNSFRIT